MKTLKLIWIKIPEYYIILLAIGAIYTPPFSFSMNPIAIGLFVVVIFQIIFRNKISGIIISIIFILINVYTLFVVLSGFNEYQTFNSKAKLLLFAGISFFILNLLMSAGMLYKYSQETEFYINQLKPKR